VSRYLPVANPPNPFAKASFEYELEDNPGAPLQVFEDHTRSILATNDSPDVGFKWSVNPYRGCHHGCAYCLDPETPILMGDGAARPIHALRVGDLVYGTVVERGRRRYVRTPVLAHWNTVKRAFRVTLNDGTELVASGDHRFLSTRGFAYVNHVPRGGERGEVLAPGTRLVGTGAFAQTPVATPDYRRGYLAGVSCARRDARPLRLALVDLEPSRRVRDYVQALDTSRIADDASVAVLARASGEDRHVTALRTSPLGHVERTRHVVAWPAAPSREWSRGFLAAMLDVEGEAHGNVLVVHACDRRAVEATCRALEALGFESFAARDGAITIRGGLGATLRLVHTVDPAVRRKYDLHGQALDARKSTLEVVSVEDLGFEMPMVDITTGTEDFVANGIVSHNCYARPGHEYLSFGAGSDFERKIVVKPNAPALLREAFEKKSWKGDLVVFSGVTDCYQPLEHTMRLTRGCLEACVEYRNPAGFITKSPVIERDIELLAELARVARCRVSISIPFWNPEYAKAMEPYVTPPARRMKIVERLARAGVPVGVSVSPIVPGLNDEDIGEVLEAAAAAGATHAFYVLLRLPGSVKDVFEKALRERLPLRAEKVLRRLREAHGGKLYDSRFGMRQRGGGVYAQTIDALFTKTATRLGLVHEMDEPEPEPERVTFRRPDRSPQRSFGF